MVAAGRREVAGCILKGRKEGRKEGRKLIGF
jgi:hypothetical protein